MPPRLRACSPFRLVLALAVIGCAPPSGAQWSRTLGGPDPGEGIHAVGRLPTGEIVVAATTDSFGTRTGDAWLIRLDSTGAVLSESVTGNAIPGGVDGAAVMPDGGAVFASRNVRDIFVNHDALVVRLAADGTLQWATQVAATTGRFFINDLVPMSNGDVVGVGNAAITDAGPMVGWIIRFDALGNVLGQDYHGGVVDTSTSFEAAVETSDGGVAIAGWYATSSGEDVLVARAGAAGNLSWLKVVGGPDADRADAIVAVPGSSAWIVAGTTQSYASSGRAGWVLRFDDPGTFRWSSVLGDAEWSDLQAATIGPDGNAVVLGRISEPGFPTNDLWALGIVPADGSIAWQRAYEGDSGDYAGDVVATSDPGLIYGATWAWGFPEEDLWVLRTTADGSIPGCRAVRTTSVARTSPAAATSSPFLPPYPPLGTASAGSAVSDVSSATVVERCAPSGCVAPTCGPVSAIPPSACEGQSFTLSLLVSGGTPPIGVTWDLNGDTLAEVMGNPVSVTLAAGSHPVSATATDSCPTGGLSCSSATTLVVHPDQTPTITPDGPTTFCAGDDVTLDAGAGYASHAWTRDGFPLPGETARTLRATTSGTYRVAVVDANGCAWTSLPIVVTVHPDRTPTITPDGPTTFCAGDDVTLDAGAGYASHAWSKDGLPLPGEIARTLRATASGAYAVAVVDANGCPWASAPIVVAVHPDQTPTITPDGPTTFCAARGESVTLDAGAGYSTHQWLLDGSPLPLETSRTLVASASGSYSVSVVDGNGCPWSSAPVDVDGEACSGCLPLSCDDLEVTPPLRCEGTQLLFVLRFSGGSGVVSVAWDLDGDTTPETPGNGVLATLPVGITTVTGFAADECAPVPQSCQLALPVEILAGTAPGEVSDVLAGAPPLFVLDRGARLSFEDLPAASAYNLYADAIGSWYAPNAPSGSACFIATAAGAPGRLDAAVTLATNTWVLVTASSACAEGDAGTDSSGVDRTTVGTWSRCGGAP